MKVFVKCTRTVLNYALALHKTAMLLAVDDAYKYAEKAARNVVEHKKFVQLVQEEANELTEVSRNAKAHARTVEALAKAELARLPSSLA